MSGPKKSAKAAARHRSAVDIWIDHAEMVDGDESWLGEVERLTLWNVRFPTGFLSRLTALQWLDVRGGSDVELKYLSDCGRLEMLAINQVRGIQSLETISGLEGLRFLSLYGLPKLASGPSLSKLVKLHRLELGSLRGLQSLGPLLEAPNLRELLITRKMGPESIDARAISAHPTLRSFDWFADDVPMKTWLPVRDAISLPRTRPMLPDAWFAIQ